MAITLGTNITAYSARLNLNNVADNLTNIMERLSSGSKINKAGDDASGLVVSQNMEASIRGSKQAMSNIQNAASFLQVAEDGMISISDHYQRINDLLTNMANDTNDTDSRTAAVDEIIERLNEINRLAKNINFNGMNMLDGSVESIVVQMGSDTDRETSTLDISPAFTNCKTSASGTDLPNNLNPNAYTNAAGDTVIKEEYNKGDYFVTTDNKTVIRGDDGKYYSTADGKTQIAVADESALKSVEKGYRIKGATETLVLINPRYTEGGEDPQYINATTQAAYTGEANLAKIDETKLKSSFSPTNQNCRSYMAVIQDAISKIATKRGLIGAYENRMDSSSEALSARIQSLESAKSLYTDSDVAQEASDLVQKQILQQIDVAMLSQANSMSQIALSLLGG